MALLAPRDARKFCDGVFFPQLGASRRPTGVAINPRGCNFRLPVVLWRAQTGPNIDPEEAQTTPQRTTGSPKLQPRGLYKNPWDVEPGKPFQMVGSFPPQLLEGFSRPPGSPRTKKSTSSCPCVENLGVSTGTS
jgi:hypothetical protein